MKYSLLAAVLMFTTLTLSCKSSKESSTETQESADLTSAVFSADSAMLLVEAQCRMGARVPGSVAHEQCAAWIISQFEKLGLQVSTQTSPRTMWDGRTFTMKNLFAQYKPDAEHRILLCTHWDSRPWADQDPDSTKHRSAVPAANDGASGVAVLLEVARHLQELNTGVGVDFLCFDLEDYGAPYWATGPADGTDWCVGSRYWAMNKPETYKPAYAILLDMVGGSDARFRYEFFSRQYAQSTLARVWAIAQEAGYADYFLQEDGLMLTDDHLPLNRIAGIKTIDLIGTAHDSFSSTWHTTSDTPENLSADRLKAVGQTLLQVIYEEK